MADIEKTIRSKFSELFEKNQSIEQIYKRIRNGSATYEEAHKFSLEVGEMLKDVFNKNINPESIDDIAKFVIKNMLNQNVSLVSSVCEMVQLNLNDIAGIGLNAVAPSAERLANRVDGIMTNLDETASVAKLEQSTQTLAQTVVDDWVKVNSDFQAKAGMQPVIVRKWDGTTGSHDTRHTDYCSRLQGVYEYHNEPKDVYMRHEGCQCVVSYYPSKNAKGVVTALKKGEKDINKILWNTGAEFSQSRNAVLRRRREKYGIAEARKILNAKWKGGLNGNAERHF